MHVSQSTKALLQVTLENLDVPAVDSATVDLHDHELDHIESELAIAHGHVEAVSDLLASESEAPEEADVVADAQAKIQEHIKAIDALLPEGTDTSASAPILQASLEALAGAETQGTFKKAWEAFKRFLKHLLDKMTGFFGMLLGGVGRLKAQCEKLKGEVSKLSGKPVKKEIAVVKPYLFNAGDMNGIRATVAHGPAVIKSVVTLGAHVLSEAFGTSYSLPDVNAFTWPAGYGLDKANKTIGDKQGKFYVYARKGNGQRGSSTIMTPTIDTISSLIGDVEELVKALGTSNAEISAAIKSKASELSSENGPLGKWQSNLKGIVGMERFVIGATLSCVNSIEHMAFVVANAALKTCANAIHAYHGSAEAK